MTTPVEVSTLWSIWNRTKQGLGFVRRRFEKIAALEARVTALEAALARCPAEGCPFCGARAFRLKEVMMRGEMEVWQCGECNTDREYRYDLPGQLPPGSNPNRSIKPKR
jgi:ribosomal protein L37AE/L43A